MALFYIVSRYFKRCRPNIALCMCRLNNLQFCPDNHLTACSFWSGGPGGGRGRVRGAGSGIKTPATQFVLTYHAIGKKLDLSQTDCMLPGAHKIHCFYLVKSQQTQNIGITFVQCRTNVEDVGPTLYKCYRNVLCSLGWLSHAPKYYVQV